MSVGKALNDSNYKSIIDEYLYNNRVSMLNSVPHHDTNRLNHSIKVSYYSYKICKRLHLNYKSAAKAGLFHDLYYEQIDSCDNIKSKVKLFANNHPKHALENAKKVCSLTPLEENIILSHMWPTSKYMPKYIESFVVSIVDKVVSLFEFKRRYYYKLSYVCGVYFLLLSMFIFKN